MKQINLHKIDWVKTGLLILSLVLIILFFRQCGSTEKYELAIKERQNTIKKSEELEKIHLKKIDAAEKKIVVYEKKAKYFEAKTKDLKKELSKTAKSNNDKIKNLTNGQAKKYLVEKYKAKITTDTVTERKIVVDLINGDGYKGENKILNKIVASQDSTLVANDSIIGEKDKSIEGFKYVIKEITYQKQAKDKTIEEQAKIAKKQKHKKQFWVVVSGVLTTLLILK
jgi:septal ring factor EnvC (AmiA/AmiB activator)